MRLNHLTSARSSPLSGGHHDMRALLLHLRRMHRRRIVHGDDAKGLQAAIASALPGKATRDPSSAVWKPSRLRQVTWIRTSPRPPPSGRMKSISLCDIEPFDGAGNLDDPRIVAFVADKGFVSGIFMPRDRGFFPIRTPLSWTGTADSRFKINTAA